MVRDEDLERAEAYILIGHLFKAAPSAETLQVVGEFEGDASPLGHAVGRLAGAARALSPDEVAHEYDRLFGGLQPREDIAPYAAVHLAGGFYGHVVASLRDDLAALGIARREEETEPEDHISALCEVMAGLLTGRLGGGAGQEAIAAFYGRHLQPWAPEFAAGVENQAETAPFYAAAGCFARLFLEQEGALFR